MGAVVFKGQSVLPGKVVFIGKNYAAHIEEMASATAENMVVFMKPATSFGTALFAALDERLHYAGEICLLMQGSEVIGVGFGLDLTKRDTQEKLKAAGLPWERSKAFTGSALFSEFVTAPEDLTQLGVELVVDDAVRQKGDVSLMLYPPRRDFQGTQSISSSRRLRHRHDRRAGRGGRGPSGRTVLRASATW